MIRKADYKDNNKISELWFQMHEDLDWPSSVLRESCDKKTLYLNIVARNEHPDWSIFISEEDGEIVGFIMCYIHWPDYSQTYKLVTCEAIFVQQEYRGKYIYKQLIEEATKWANEKSAEYIEIVSSNTERMINFYESMTFTPLKLIWRKKLEV